MNKESFKKQYVRINKQKYIINSLVHNCPQINFWLNMLQNYNIWKKKLYKFLKKSHIGVN